jgi:hypothetical protein
LHSHDPLFKKTQGKADNQINREKRRSREARKHKRRKAKKLGTRDPIPSKNSNPFKIKYQASLSTAESRDVIILYNSLVLLCGDQFTPVPQAHTRIYHCYKVT